MNHQLYGEDFTWSFNPFTAITEETRVPSWYEIIGWWVKIDQTYSYIINDQTYLVDSEHQSTSYFNKFDSSANQFYHEFEYTYSIYDGTKETSTSRFFYVVDGDEINFTFTHAFTDIYVYAVYRMVEYDVNVDISAPTGSTYFHDTEIVETSLIYDNFTLAVDEYKTPIEDVYGVIFTYYLETSEKVYYNVHEKRL